MPTCSRQRRTERWSLASTGDTGGYICIPWACEPGPGASVRHRDAVAIAARAIANPESAAEGLLLTGLLLWRSAPTTHPSKLLMAS